MAPQEFLAGIINPGLQFLAQLGGPAPTDDVRRFLLAVALQESGPELMARYQGSPGAEPGPANGFWQFERGGGVAGVLSHAASATLALDVCAALTVVPEAAAIHRCLEGHDVLAVAFARLLLLTDPYPVPVTQDAAYECYNARLWRPGSPRPEDWPLNWRTAALAVSGPAVA